MSGSTLLVCNDGGEHQWRSDGNSPDGMVCGGCGVSEAELDHLLRQESRRVTSYRKAGWDERGSNR